MSHKGRHRFALIGLLLACPASFAADWLYTVRPGDTLWDLCKRYTNEPNCWQKIDKVNNVVYPRRLPPGFVVSFPVAWLKTTPTPVQVSYVMGEASVILGQEKPVPLKAGDQLPIGAIIHTGEGSVSLVFANGNIMLLEAHSELILDTFSSDEGSGMVDSRLRLQRGSVKTRVLKRSPASRFQITTPAAVAAVRGTEYRVSSNPAEQDLTRSEVFEGLVGVSAGTSQQAVAAGYGISARAGETLPAPVKLLAAPAFAAMDSNTMLPVTLNWQATAGADKYQLEILNDNDLEQVLRRIVTPEHQQRLEALATGCYRLRLRAIDPQGLQGLAANRSLCIDDPLQTPELSAERLTIEGNQLQLHWPAIDNATGYRVEFAFDSAFNDVVSDSTLSEPVFTGEFSAMSGGYIRVQALAANGQSSAASQPLIVPEKNHHLLALVVFGVLALVAF